MTPGAVSKTWIEPAPVAVPEALAAAVGGHPLVAEALARRGLLDAGAALAFLDPDHYRPSPAGELPGLDAAARRIAHALRRRERICVWGDFDVDGQTATTILVSTLRDLGGDVAYHIPVRDTESHGVNLPRLQAVIADGARLILTCDTGISAHDAVQAAQAAGVDTIVTDHHDLPDSLPAAYAVVDPKLLPPRHPLADLPGAGVAYKLAEELFARARRPDDASQLLDLVALAIVADVANQAADTRYLLQRGLRALRVTRRAGLLALMELAELAPAGLTEEHIGFVIGPRLNALGRLADANPAVELLTTSDRARAAILAHELDGLNARRKLMCDQVYAAAADQIARDPALAGAAALVLSGPAWPAGVIGIVAGRLADEYDRPTILIAAPPGGPGRGSARSVPGCNITAAIAANRDLLLGFGGHPLAAGLGIDPARIPDFRRGLCRTVAAMRGDPPPAPALRIDAFVSLAELTPDLVADVERLAPFGHGNPPLAFASRDLTLVEQKPIGRGGEHLALTVADAAGHTARVLWWQGAGRPLPAGRFDLAYAARSGDYRGEATVQIEWIDARAIAESPVTIRSQGHAPEVVDLRNEADPRTALARLMAGDGVQVWCEGQGRQDVGGKGRQEIVPCRVLVIWTAPPGREELLQVLTRAAARTVCLLGADPGLDTAGAFLARLAGLVKYALRATGGQAHLEVLAAATAQHAATVRAGLAWLAAHGDIVMATGDEEALQITKGDGRPTPDLAAAAARLDALLAETAAYRVHFRRAAPETLLAPLA